MDGLAVVLDPSSLVTDRKQSHFAVKMLDRVKMKKSLSESSNDGGNLKSHRGAFKKMGCSQKLTAVSL